MIKPWKVLQELNDLVVECWVSSKALTLEQVTAILDEDSPGTWIPDDMEQKDQLDLLGIEWSDIEEIFEDEIEELVAVAATKRAQVMPR